MPHPRQTNLAEESYKIFIPAEYLADFEVNHIETRYEDYKRIQGFFKKQSYSWLLKLLISPFDVSFFACPSDSVRRGFRFFCFSANYQLPTATADTRGL